MVCAGNDEEAEDCFSRGLQLVEAVTGPGHDDAVFSLGAYAAFLKSVLPYMCATIHSVDPSASQLSCWSVHLPGCVSMVVGLYILKGRMAVCRAV